MDHRTNWRMKNSFLVVARLCGGGSAVIALGAVVSGLSGLINPKRASIPGGRWRGRVFSTWAAHGGVNYATGWREEARVGIVLALV